MHEKGDNTIPIVGATFQLRFTTPYLSEPIVIDIISDSQGRVVEADRRPGGWGEPEWVLTPSTRQVSLPNGTYTLKQLSTDAEHLIQESDLTFSVYGRPDN